MTKRKAKPEAGYYAYEGLDRVLHEKARLGILTALVARTTGVTFVDLKRLCSLTDGNLARHLQTLQDAGMVEVEKARDGRRSVTFINLSDDGRAQFVDYLGELERVIRDAREVGARRRRLDDGGLAPA